MSTDNPTHERFPIGKIFFLVAAVALLGAAVVFLFASEEAEASHFRGGTLQWNGTPVRGGGAGLPVPVPSPPSQPIAYISGSLAYRCSAFYSNCPSSPPPNGSVMTTAPGSIDFGDGSAASRYPDWTIQLTVISKARDYWVGKIVDQKTLQDIQHLYPDHTNNGNPWIVSWNDYCRVGGGHVNNPCGAEVLRTNVDLADPNHSPVVDLIPLRYCMKNSMCTFPIYAMDPDNDTMHFRLSTACEADMGCKFTQPGPPHAKKLKIDPDTGVVTWNTRGATLKSDPTLYSVQVMVEDGIGWVPEDFMIELVDKPTTGCPNGSEPYIDPETKQPKCKGRPIDCSDPEMAATEACEQKQETSVPPPTQGNDPEKKWYPDPQAPAPAVGRGVSAPHAAINPYLDGQNMDLAMLDSDGDNIPDQSDLCPYQWGGGTDIDHDGMGDACDADMDNDGVDNAMDACPMDLMDKCNGTAKQSQSPVNSGSNAQGEMAETAAPERTVSDVAVQEAKSAKDNSGIIMLGILGGAMVLLVAAVAFRR